MVWLRLNLVEKLQLLYCHPVCRVQATQGEGEKRTHTHTKSLTNPFPNDKYLAESAELLIADDYSSL